MEKITLRLRTFIQQNRLEIILISLIVIIALFFRLYKIDQYLTFLGDEGRDARIMRDLVHGNLVFIGPQTSVGNMYLGPLYYYLAAPFLLLFGFSPVGPAVFVTLTSIAAIVLTWWVGRTFFNRETGLLAALLFAVSPVAIIHGRTSWNPNPMPLFAIVCFWSLVEVWRNRKFNRLLILSASFASGLQMHYLGALLLPTLLLFWFFTLFSLKPKEKKSFFKYTVLSLVIFFLLMSPLLLFDLKHDWLNLRALTGFLHSDGGATSVSLLTSLYTALKKVGSDLILPSFPLIAASGLALLLISSVFLFKNPAFSPLFFWLAFGILGLNLNLTKRLFSHYYAFLFPAIFLLLGLFLSFLIKKNKFTKILAVVLFLLICFDFLRHSPLLIAPNRQLQRTQDAVNQIISISDGQPFNFGLIAKQNYDESYRYFFENQNAPLIRGENGITKQLFVICEDGPTCQPLNNPEYQVAIFGPAKIDREWMLDHLRIYRLLHS